MAILAAIGTALLGLGAVLVALVGVVIVLAILVWIASKDGMQVVMATALFFGVLLSPFWLYHAGQRVLEWLR